MKPAFDVQSPFFAHAEHETSESSQVRVHVAHECGQRTARYSELEPEKRDGVVDERLKRAAQTERGDERLKQQRSTECRDESLKHER